MPIHAHAGLVPEAALLHQAGVRMPRARLSVASLVLLIALLAGAQAQDVPAPDWLQGGPAALVFSPGEFYPANPLPTFMAGHLTSGECIPVYLPSDLRPACTMLRGEPSWVGTTVRWSGPGLLVMQPAHERWVRVWLKDARGRATLLSLDAALGLSGGAPTSRALVTLEEGAWVSVRLDLSELIIGLPVGAYTICYDVVLQSDPVVPQVGRRRRCHDFGVHEIATHGSRVERLRREAVDLIAAYRCDDAAPVVDALLREHPTSAAGFRLRGIIAELRRQNREAAADYRTVVEILRAGQDELLASPAHVDWRRAADDLAGWRQSMLDLMEFGPGLDLSLLGPADDGPACR
jgi:hypothetical protein